MIDDKHYRTLYRASCDECGYDRGYLTKQNAQKYSKCKSCCHKDISDDTRQKMSKSKIGKTAWNKGITGVTPNTSEKMRDKKIGKSPKNKGIPMTLEQKIKLSCANRSILVSDFDDFKTPAQKKERNKFSEMGLHIRCFEKYNYSCDRCGLHGVILNAHHKNSWKHFSEQRFELDNLVSLCEVCHKGFHELYGNGKSSANTEQQYYEYKNTFVHKIRRLIIIGGVAGSGKSWICDQLSIPVISYDSNKKNLLPKLWNIDSDIIVCDLHNGISTFIKRYSHLFNIDLYIIDESEEIIKARLESRGGAFTKHIKNRIQRMKALSKIAKLSGSSEEILRELSSIS